MSKSVAIAVRWYLDYARTHSTAYLALLRGAQEAAFPEVRELIENLRREVVDRILTDLNRAGDPAATLGLRGYLGYLDSITAEWLTTSADGPATGS
jgi:tetracycline repressor-like protein